MAINENMPIYIKMLFTGDSGVGKSTVLTKLFDDTFSETFLPTIGVDYKMMSAKIKKPNTEYKLKIWDTAGDERFHSITSSYYRHCNIVLIFYDISNQKTFKNISHWLKQIEYYALSSTHKVLIGNKSDITDQQVEYDQAKELAVKNNMQFYEVSAKNNSKSEFRNIFENIMTEYVNIKNNNLAFECDNIENNNHVKNQVKVEIKKISPSEVKANGDYLKPKTSKNKKTELNSKQKPLQAPVKLVRLLLVGDSGVGKSSLMQKFVENTYSDIFLPTIGVDFKIHTFQHKKIPIKLQIWDTAGQERFKTITSSYYRGSNGVIIVFDTTNETSFKNLVNWLELTKLNAPKNIKILLVGNKCDLTENRKVDLNKITKFVEENNFCDYFETSAKNGKNIENVFKTLACDNEGVDKTKFKNFKNSVNNLFCCLRKIGF